MPIFVEPGARWRSLEKLVSPGFSAKNALKTVKIVCRAYCCGLPRPRERKIGNRRSIGGRSPYQRPRLHESEVAALPCVHPIFEDILTESLRNANQRISKRKRNHLVGSPAVGKKKIRSSLSFRTSDRVTGVGIRPLYEGITDYHDKFANWSRNDMNERRRTIMTRQDYERRFLTFPNVVTINEFRAILGGILRDSSSSGNVPPASSSAGTTWSTSTSAAPTTSPR